MFGQCLRFVHLGLRSILVLFEKAKMDKDEVLPEHLPSIPAGGNNEA